MSIRYISASAYNLQKPDDNEVSSEATEKDLLFEIGNIYFMIQRENDWNNVVCFRVAPSKMSFAKVILEFRKVMIAQNIQYIRVEGSKKRYNWLPEFIKRAFGNTGADIIKSNEDCDRNVFYIKCW